MATQQSELKPAMRARIIHGSYVAGCVIFAVLLYFVIVPRRTDLTADAMVINLLLGLALAGTALSFFVLRRRVPNRSMTESADLYWTSAFNSALVTWAPLEGGALAALIAYMLSGNPAALLVAAIPIGGLIALHPGRMEQPR